MNKLIIPMLKTTVIGAIALGALLFLPAGTLDYWQAWVFMVVFMTSTNAIGVYLSLKDPELLERRKKFGPAAEQRVTQKIIMSLTLVGVLALLVFPAVDHRFAWSPVPAYVSLAGDALVALGLYIDFLALRENSYGGSNIRTEEDQKVITTGPYALVRHPIYIGALVMVIGVPLALDSLWGLAILAFTLPVLIWRILDEEALLKEDLPGYTEYSHKVPYRLVPHLW